MDSFGSGPRIVIKPLSTVGDSGTPTESVAEDILRVLDLIEDERHLVAHDLYLNVQSRLGNLKKQKQEYDRAAADAALQAADSSNKGRKAWRSSRKTADPVAEFDEAAFDQAVDLLRENKPELDLLKKRAPLLIKARDNMDESEGWTLAQTLFGVTTYYRREEDNSLSVKLEGELKGIPLFEQIAVLREIDLYAHWAPFCSSSQMLGHLGKLDSVGWMMIGLPNFGIARDSCFRAVGCDCVAEDGSVIMIGRGVEDNVSGAPVDETSKFLSHDPILKNLDIPPIPTRMGSGRLTMKMFEAKIKVLGPDHCHTYILANVDPNLAFVPQALIEFVTKKMCGFLLNKLQTAAKKIITHPVRNIHAQRMRDEKAFYQHWLLPKFKAIAADNGWSVPTIAAFELSGAQKVEADRLNAKRTTKMHSFSRFQSTDDDGGDNSVSTRSAPAAQYRGQRSSSSDDASDISSLSGTSQSIWKHNPISSYLRDIESKTQERKDKAVNETRRMAADRLRPRPLPVDKKKRLAELKMHKHRKQRARTMSSGGSMEGSLPPVDEHPPDDATVRTGRSLPYSPLKSALKGKGHWPRMQVIVGLVLLLFVLLHVDRFLPTFSSESFGMFSPLLRDTVTLCYIMFCGAIHFMLCDIELIYAFEAFEMGMKTGEQVKSFYRGKVRLVVAIGSGVLVGISIFKAVLLASVRASVLAAISFYNLLLSGGEIEDVTKIDFQVPFLDPSEDATVADAISTVEALITPDEVNEAKWAILSHESGFCAAAYSTFMTVVYAVFNWQMRVFVQSNFIGRSIARLVTGFYSLYIGILSGIGNAFYSLVSIGDEQGGSLSWRDDAISTLRNLLLYTACFLLAVLILVEYVSKSYRYKDTPPDSMKTSSSSIDESTAVSNGGTMPMPKPQKISSATKSIDSTKKRLTFRRKRKENALDGDESD